MLKGVNPANPDIGLPVSELLNRAGEPLRQLAFSRDSELLRKLLRLCLERANLSPIVQCSDEECGTRGYGRGDNG